MGIHFHTVLFYLMAVIASGFALAVVLSSNIVRMAFYLVASLAGVAGLFFLAGADMVAALQLMIYVGGTLVLLIFGVMLTARGPFVNMKTSLAQWAVAAMIGASLLAVLLYAAVSVGKWTEPGQIAAATPVQAAPTSTPIGLGLLGVRVDRLVNDQTNVVVAEGNNPVAAAAKAEGKNASLAEGKNASLAEGMSGYLLPFEIISVHLVVVLIGAAYLARPRRRVTPNPTAARPASETADNPSQPQTVS